MDYSDWVLIRNHYYLGAKNSGASRTLSGDVKVLHILINDMASNWMYPAHIAEYQQAAAMMDLVLNTTAMMHGHRLSVQSVFCQAYLPMVADQTGMWVPYAFSALGFPSSSAMQSFYESQFGCQEAPIIFAFNRPMRSFAGLNNDRSFFRQEEFSAVFRQPTGMFDSKVLIHELLHQFGAADYYYPQVTVDAAYRHFPTSIMFQGGDVIDDLTRYLIGWTDELTPTAVAFLKETMSVDDAMLMQARMRGV